MNNKKVYMYLTLIIYKKYECAIVYIYIYTYTIYYILYTIYIY